MQHLFEKLRDDTLNWRKEGYPCPDYPLIGEVLRYQFEGEPPEQISLKYPGDPGIQEELDTENQRRPINKIIMRDVHMKEIIPLEPT